MTSPPVEMVRTATPFPMVSLLFVFTAFVISNIGHIRPQRTILAFVSGIFFILSGGTALLMSCCHYSFTVIDYRSLVCPVSHVETLHHCSIFSV